MPYIDAVGEYLNWDKKEFNNRAENWLENDAKLGNYSWEDRNEMLQKAVGLQILYSRLQGRIL